MFFFNRHGWTDVCTGPSPSPAVVCSSEAMTAFNSSAINLRTPREGVGSVWALYGILQLPNRLACSDDTSSVPNICQQSCQSRLRHRTRIHTPDFLSHEERYLGRFKCFIGLFFFVVVFLKSDFLIYSPHFFFTSKFIHTCSLSLDDAQVAMVIFLLNLIL